MSRPIPVIMFGILDIFFGACEVIKATSGKTTARALSMWLGWIPLLTSALLIVAGVGLLTVKPWSRKVALGASVISGAYWMLWTALAILSALGGVPEMMVYGTLAFIKLIFPSLQVYYLTRPPIIAAFTNIVPATVEPLPPTQSY